MKKRKIIALTIAITLLFGLFLASNASAAWMSNATVKNVNSSSASYTIGCYLGTWNKAFNVPAGNADAILAIALTAISSGQDVTIEYTGSTILNIYILE